MPDIYIAPKKSKDLNKPKKEKNLKIIDHLYQELGLKPTRFPLAAFVALPKKVHFETQGKEEQIILLLRPHWITNITWIMITAAMIVAPSVLKFLPLLQSFPPRFKIIILLMWYLLILGFAFERFLSWFYNLFIITNERVVDVDFYSLMYREISQANLEKIQDITIKTGGLLHSVFNFGDVLVQTAGETVRIEFESVPRPDMIVQVINKLMEKQK